MTIREAVERSRGHIEKCEPSFGKRVASWYSELMSKKIPVLIYCSIRTPQEQEELYAQGRTKMGKKVTNARGIPPQSLHIDLGRGSHAIDYVPLARTPSGDFVASWDDDQTYSICQKIAQKHQLRHLDWEQPHLEDATISGWRELISPQKQEVNNQKVSLVSKRPWSSR
jgi:peptidoglycan L-alanyl-D-glutamate endopeptidase CwlK